MKKKTVMSLLAVMSASMMLMSAEMCIRDSSYSLLTDVGVYPVINGSVFYLDDFPSPEMCIRDSGTADQLHGTGAGRDGKRSRKDMEDDLPGAYRQYAGGQHAGTAGV